ncbi:unnamed protein product [Didymodactylos carnosus]|uniref:Uncharacterized protein n=1 Tax=Didymodactylos carnosus TaxID=1234261 RepID=A0A815PL25_9BILA|nr:unnamed protein product [Didymodactylos carnosus]CAF4323689.1 unnamed protein product [Didymodactylos carnosus]
MNLNEEIIHKQEIQYQIEEEMIYLNDYDNDLNMPIIKKKYFNKIEEEQNIFLQGKNEKKNREIFIDENKKNKQNLNDIQIQLHQLFENNFQTYSDRKQLILIENGIDLIFLRLFDKLY